MGWTVWGSNLGGQNIFLFSETVQTDFRVLSQGYSSCGIKLTTYLHLVLRLRIRRAVFLLFVHAFRAWMRDNNFTIPVTGKHNAHICDAFCD
jgi:hypothetical protein